MSPISSATPTKAAYHHAGFWCMTNSLACHWILGCSSVLCTSCAREAAPVVSSHLGTDFLVGLCFGLPRLHYSKNCLWQPLFHPYQDLPLTDTICSTCNLCVKRRGARVVEGTGLENRHAGNGIEGSNPSLSAILRRPLQADYGEWRIVSNSNPRFEGETCSKACRKETNS
jgi:hypothetical protein